MPDFIASKDGTVTRDPGAAASDPARRPGQPGAERQQVDNTISRDSRSRPGEMDERGVPLPRDRGEEVASEPAPMEAELHEDAPPLSDGSTRSGPP